MHVPKKLKGCSQMNKYIQESQQNKRGVRDITFHYTAPEVVKECLAITPIIDTESILDAGSGKNKVWFNTLTNKNKYECEIEDGIDFYKWDRKVDWVIGNPPFSEGNKFLFKASEIAQKGIAFLGNINFFNSLTPVRLKKLAEIGFTINHIHITSDKRWYGRYYWIIFSKNKKEFISW